MASVCTNKKTNRRAVQFVGLDGKRRTLRLGQCSKRFADAVASHIEHLLAAAAAGEAPPVPTVDFLSALPDRLHARFVATGLVHPRESATALRLSEHADAYLAKRTDIKPASRLVLGHVVRNLKDYFGTERPLATITAGDADDFARWLATGARARGKSGKGLSPATIGKRLQWCATIFRDARKRKLIGENPFEGLKVPKATNPERQHYVPASTIEALLDTIPDAEFRLLLALARYLGLRIPSEAFSLTWDCVDWERGRLRVPSPKTAVHAKPFRVVPLVPEVRRHLEAVYDAAVEGTTYVLHNLRQRESARTAARGFWGNLNLRKRLTVCLERAGIKRWPKLFHNLRASAATDLAQRFPAYVCADWLGHTEAIAKAHYLMTTETHFQAALNPAEKALQNPTHALHERPCFDAHGATENEKTPCFQGVSHKQVECSAPTSNTPFPAYGSEKRRVSTQTS